MKNEPRKCVAEIR